jgi:hypothetical protein
VVGAEKDPHLAEWRAVMLWNDDSWRDSYDSWKLASPDDEYDEPECDHDDYETDILDGRCRCSCGRSWYASDAQVTAEIERQRAYFEYEERENRRQWWSDLLYNFRHPLVAIHWQMQKRGWFRSRVMTDDEIPF